MELRQLLSVVTVADCGTVTGAAKALHIVQPAVTRHLQALENELGLAVFERTRAGMRPTPGGQLFLERARRILLEVERARAEVSSGPTGPAGIVALGLLESLIELVAEPLVRSVAQHHPGIDLRVLTAYSGHLQGWLETGDLDLTLLYDLESTSSLTTTPLVEEQMWAVSSTGTGLRRDVPVAAETVFAQRLVLPVRGHGLRTLMDALRVTAGAPPADVAAEVNYLPLQLALVRANVGWTVLPASAVTPHIDAGGLEGAPLGDPPATRRVVLGLPRGRRVSSAVQVVHNQLISTVLKAASEGKWRGVTPLVRASPALDEAATAGPLHPSRPS
jgi:DNA-binding transcriptional LysR family regulator